MSSALQSTSIRSIAARPVSPASSSRSPIRRSRACGSSVTKQFTGLAVMLLVEDGKLDIDQPLCRYLPDLLGPNGAPTPRQLLNHTSGVRDAQIGRASCRERVCQYV